MLELMLEGALAFLLASLSVTLSKSAVSATVGMVIAWGLVLIFYDLANAARILQQQDLTTKIDSSYWLWIFPPRWHLRTLIQLIQLTLPMGLVMMLISLNTNIPRYFIEHYLGERELGIFAAIAPGKACCTRDCRINRCSDFESRFSNCLLYRTMSLLRGDRPEIDYGW